ncbi:hypothetical protein AADZ86_02850 [Colwelliaceae bacterium BS250]
MNPHLPEVVVLIVGTENSLVGEAENASVGETDNSLVGETLVLRYGVASFFEVAYGNYVRMNPHLPKVVALIVGAGNSLIGEAENVSVGETLVLRYGVASMFEVAYGNYVRMNPHLPEVVVLIVGTEKSLISEAENVSVGGTLVLRYGVASLFEVAYGNYVRMKPHQPLVVRNVKWLAGLHLK